MNPIEIRKATVSDVEAIQKLSIQTFKETFAAVNMPENLAKLIDFNLLTLHRVDVPAPIHQE